MDKDETGSCIFFPLGAKGQTIRFFWGCFEGSAADCETAAFPFFPIPMAFFFSFKAAAPETAEAVHSSGVISLLLQPFPTLSPMALLGERRNENAGQRLAAGDVTPPLLSRAQHVTLSKAGTLRPVSMFGACINTASSFFFGGCGGLFFFSSSPSMSLLMRKVGGRHKCLIHPLALPPLRPSPPK